MSIGRAITQEWLRDWNRIDFQPAQRIYGSL